MPTYALYVKDVEENIFTERRRFRIFFERVPYSQTCLQTWTFDPWLAALAHAWEQPKRLLTVATRDTRYGPELITLALHGDHEETPENPGAAAGESTAARSKGVA
jgi:hypothetical protein